jgi:TolB-like protein/ankyrin repeat protein/class 3 adenylate cyclase
LGYQVAKDRLSDKLAVILHADVAGSTALVQQDEHLAHERIQDSFRRFGEIIEKYRGKVLELRGDALLAEFERASDAVSATLAFQADQAYYLSRLKDDLKPIIRVGIAMGEVVIADGTVTGAGVVLAQRIEQLAEPGSLCITAALHEALPNRMPFDLENIGEKALKGFDEPVRVYRVELSSGASIPPPQHENQPKSSQKPWQLKAAIAVGVVVIVIGIAYQLTPTTAIEEPASIERMAFPLPDKPSIAVLPFTNMSDDAEQEYFADGMTEDLITDISKISGLFVIARNSVFTYKGKAVKVRQVAEELGVRYVMEGSVRRAGNQVRVNAQLIDATTGGHLWAERYDGSLDDVFAMQDKITRSIVTALAVTLTGQEQVKLVQSETSNPDAYDAFLQGWKHYQRHTVDDSAKAVHHFEAALRLDSQYAQAHAALAAVYWEAGNNHWTEALNISSVEAMKSAKQHLHEAMKQSSPLAHWVASNILIAEGNYQAAVTEARQIVALDSNNADGYAILANALALAGKLDESIKLIDKAVRLNPNSSPLHAATKKGDANDVRRLIAEGLHIDAKDYFGKTALHVAADTGQAEIAAFLIEAGADIEEGAPGYPDLRFKGATPLIIAALLGQTIVAELLISAGADVNARNTSNLGHTRSVLHNAVIAGKKEVAELLIVNGAYVDAVTSIRQYTPLISAARNGHRDMVKLLISKDANVNAVDYKAATPLYNAVISGDFDTVQLLLANGADVHAKLLGGETPLHATAYSNNTRIAELLLANGAEINVADQYGYTPLRSSVDKGNLAIAELLIKKGADIKTKDPSGVTPLHIVARTDNIALARLLIAGGADINAKDKNSGFTPLDYAQGGDEGMIEMLRQHNALCAIC